MKRNILKFIARHSYWNLSGQWFVYAASFNRIRCWFTEFSWKCVFLSKIMLLFFFLRLFSIALLRVDHIKRNMKTSSKTEKKIDTIFRLRKNYAEKKATVFFSLSLSFAQYIATSISQFGAYFRYLSEFKRRWLYNQQARTTSPQPTEQTKKPLCFSAQRNVHVIEDMRSPWLDVILLLCSCPKSILNRFNYPFRIWYNISNHHVGLNFRCL